MNKYIEERIYNEAYYIIENKSTVREVAKLFNVSKSTVHKDLQERLEKLNRKLHKEVNKIFQEHINSRHLRGGEATKQKFQKLKEG